MILCNVFSTNTDLTSPLILFKSFFVDHSSGKEKQIWRLRIISKLYFTQYFCKKFFSTLHFK